MGPTDEPASKPWEPELDMGEDLTQRIKTLARWMSEPCRPEGSRGNRRCAVQGGAEAQKVEEIS